MIITTLRWTSPPVRTNKGLALPDRGTRPLAAWPGYKEPAAPRAPPSSFPSCLLLLPSSSASLLGTLPFLPAAPPPPGPAAPAADDYPSPILPSSRPNYPTGCFILSFDTPYTENRWAARAHVIRTRCASVLTQVDLNTSHAVVLSTYERVLLTASSIA